METALLSLIISCISMDNVLLSTYITYTHTKKKAFSMHLQNMFWHILKTETKHYNHSNSIIKPMNTLWRLQYVTKTLSFPPQYGYEIEILMLINIIQTVDMWIWPHTGPKIILYLWTSSSSLIAVICQLFE